MGFERMDSGIGDMKILRVLVVSVAWICTKQQHGRGHYYRNVFLKLVEKALGVILIRLDCAFAEGRLGA
jgi:hypothetical protein